MNGISNSMEAAMMQYSIGQCTLLLPLEKTWENSNTFSGAHFLVFELFFVLKGFMTTFTCKWTILWNISSLMLISISKRESLLSASVLAARTSLSVETCWGKSSMVLSTVERRKTMNAEGLVKHRAKKYSPKWMIIPM